MRSGSIDRLVAMCEPPHIQLHSRGKGRNGLTEISARSEPNRSATHPTRAVRGHSILTGIDERLARQLPNLSSHLDCVVLRGPPGARAFSTIAAISYFLDGAANSSTVNASPRSDNVRISCDTSDGRCRHRPWLRSPARQWPGSGGRRHQGRGAAAAHRSALPGRAEAEARLRPVGGGRQRQGRHQGGRQDLSGRDRLCRLRLEHAARRAVGRAADYRGQGVVPVRAVRLGRHQGGERDLREVPDPHAGAVGVLAGNLRPGLQVHLLHAHRQRDRVGADRQAGGRQEQKHQARRRAGAQRPVSARRRPGVREGVKAEGMEVVAAERYAIGAMDHSAAITKMRGVNPDWVYASGYINDLMLIRRQMNDLGLKAPVITMIAGPAYAEFAKTVGPLADNVTSMSWWHPALRYKGPDVFGSTEAFNAAYAKANNRS